MANLNLILPRERNAIPIHDPLSMYKTSDTDQVADPQYFGNLSHNGAYYIQKWNVAAGTFRYYAGMGDYSTKWTNRASLPYDTFDAIF